MFAALKEKLKGYRTLIASGAVIAVGAANSIGAIDIAPIVHFFIKDDQSVAVTMIVLGVSFGLLRFVTTSSPGTSGAPPDQGATVFNRGVDQGD